MCPRLPWKPCGDQWTVCGIQSCGFSRFNKGHQALILASLPVKPSHWPITFFIIALYTVSPHINHSSNGVVEAPYSLQLSKHYIYYL